MSVYFITAREVGKVKIGCACDPFRRLAHLQTSSPVELSLEAIFQGAYKQEKEYHERFAEHRVRGEWFVLCSEIEALISAAAPPKRPVSVADKRRLGELHEDGRMKRLERRRDERLANGRELRKRLARGDIHFPFRAKETA